MFVRKPKFVNDFYITNGFGGTVIILKRALLTKLSSILIPNREMFCKCVAVSRGLGTFQH